MGQQLSSPSVQVAGLAIGASLAVAVVSHRLADGSSRKPGGKSPRASGFQPISVNWHFTRACNYSCRFCFHTQTEPHLVKMEEAKRGLQLLKNSGMKKLNFSGGEPFLHKRFLGELVKFCKEELHLDSVSIVSNGSCIDRAWMEKYGSYVDILAVSCDSLDPNVLRTMGRCDRKGETDHIDQMKQVRRWCEEFRIVFKINTVVTSVNAHEDLTEHIRALAPTRWKVFQVLEIEGENSGSNPTSRSVADLLIAQEQFDAYIARHRVDPEVARVVVPEDNEHMRDSYLILDQRMRFLNCTTGAKIPTASILEQGGVSQALKEAGHDADKFFERGGLYTWSKAEILPVVADIEQLA